MHSTQTCIWGQPGLRPYSKHRAWMVTNRQASDSIVPCCIRLAPTYRKARVCQGKTKTSKRNLTADGKRLSASTQVSCHITWERVRLCPMLARKEKHSLTLKSFRLYSAEPCLYLGRRFMWCSNKAKYFVKNALRSLSSSRRKPRVCHRK